jgi:hypothetical protein
MSTSCQCGRGQCAERTLSRRWRRAGNGRALERESVGKTRRWCGWIRSSARPRAATSSRTRTASTGGRCPNAGQRQAPPTSFSFAPRSRSGPPQLCVELVKERIPRRFAIPPQDIQVLSPMHRGAVGVAALNERHPERAQSVRSRPARKDGGQPHLPSGRPGDADSQQLRQGCVSTGIWATSPSWILVEQTGGGFYRRRAVGYDFLELDELTHAYAVSVHKARAASSRSS